MNAADVAFTTPANDNEPKASKAPTLELVRADITPATAARFRAKVAAPNADGCMLWTGAVTSKGYGSIGWKGSDGRIRSYLSHRVAWVLAGNELDPALTLDHVAERCRSKLCANTNHLEQVTGAENSSRRARLITHCRQGHELFGDNVRTDRRGKRVCIACSRYAAKIANARRSAATANL